MMNMPIRTLLALGLGLGGSALAQDPVPPKPVETPGEQTTPPEQQDDDAIPPAVGGDTTGVKQERPQLPGGLRDKLAKPFADLKPGVMPEGTDPEAARLFRALVAGSRVDTKDAVKGPVTGFDLAFELVVRGDGVERNQLETRVRYAEPKFVRFAVRDQYEMGFGPDGYWQFMDDGYRSLVGRDYATDRKRIVEVRAVCKNFLALADPHRLRVAALRPLEAAPAKLPETVAKSLASRSLRWLEVESPDFDLALGQPEPGKEGASPARLFRATLGIDEDTGRVAEALVQELRAGVPVLSTSTWVTLGRYVAVNGVLLPDELRVRYPLIVAGRLTFEDKVREEMFLLEGQLNPKLDADAFHPAQKPK